MDIKMLRDDTCAHAFVQRVFGVPVRQEAADEILTWSYVLGGFRGVAVYSLPEDKMFMHTSRARGASPMTARNAVSLYTVRDLERSGKMSPVDFGVSAKDWNRYMRTILTPQALLEQTYAFVAINQNVATKNSDEDSVRAQMVSLSRQDMPAGTEGRGGYVIYRDLPQSQVLTEVRVLPEPLAVRYGSSSLAFTSDVLKTLKAAAKLGLPMEFDTDGTQPFLEYLERTFWVSAVVFGGAPMSGAATGSFNVPGGVFKMSPELVSALFTQANLTHVLQKASDLAADFPTAQVWCHRALAEVARMFLSNLPFSLKVDVRFTDTAEIFSPLGHQRLSYLAHSIESSAGHVVSLLNTPSGRKIDTAEARAVYGGITLQNMFAQGFRPGGALSYFAWYAQAETAPFVAYMDDKDAGRVHLLAKPQMLAGNLWAVPGGMLGLYPKAANGYIAHTSIDPWVLLEVFARLGADVLPKVVYDIWQAVEVPLAADRVGWRTYIVVSDIGVEIVKNPPGKRLV